VYRKPKSDSILLCSRRSLLSSLQIRHVLCGDTFFTASRRLFKPHNNGLSCDCVNSPSAMRSSRVLAIAGTAMSRRGPAVLALAFSARADAPPVANPAPSDDARPVATAWMRAFRVDRVGAAEATGTVTDIMTAKRTARMLRASAVGSGEQCANGAKTHHHSSFTDLRIFALCSSLAKTRPCSLKETLHIVAARTKYRNPLLSSLQDCLAMRMTQTDFAMML
jgi:hypothetical protein